MFYLLVTLSLGGKVQGRTREQNYDEVLRDRAVIPEDSEIAQTGEEKRRPEVYQEEDTPKFDDYRLEDRGDCVQRRDTKCGLYHPVCKPGCRLQMLCVRDDYK